MRLPTWMMFDRRISLTGTPGKAKFFRMFVVKDGKCRLRAYALQDLKDVQMLEGIPLDHLRGKTKNNAEIEMPAEPA
jgi:hypothetical protein